MVSPSERVLSLLAAIAESPARLRDLFGGPPPLWSGNAMDRMWQLGLVERDRAGVYTITQVGREAIANGKPPAECRGPKKRPEGTRVAIVRPAGGWRQVFRAKRSG